MRWIITCIVFAVVFDIALAANPQQTAQKAMEGYMLFTRDSLPDDRENGYAMMLEAAWEGDAKAANNLGWLLEQGIYVDKDLTGALRWYERAADQGLPAAALNYVSIIFHHPDALEGKAADTRRVARAAKIAGMALAMGRGLHYDYRQGEELLIRSALLGDEEAALTLAQQLEMYPDSFSYLPLKRIVEECNRLLPDDKRIDCSGISDEQVAEMLLTADFWYDHAGCYKLDIER